MTRSTEELEEKAEPRDNQQMNRRSFLAGLSAMGVGAGVVGNAGSARAAIGRPFVPNEFRGDDWSTPEELPREDRDGIIEWSGVKTQNKTLQHKVGEAHGELQDVPLWNLYAWTIEQNKLLQQSNEENEGFLSGISLTSFFGPVGVSADLGEVSETVSESFSEEDDFISQTAADVFADQIESDYPFMDEVTICDGLQIDSIYHCVDSDDVRYTNPAADIRNALTLEMSHSVTVEWGLDYDISYIGFLVVQTYDTDVESDLNKTFVATASVYPEEISGVETIDDYSFTDDSREFMKNTR